MPQVGVLRGDAVKTVEIDTMAELAHVSGGAEVGLPSQTGENTDDFSQS